MKIKRANKLINEILKESPQEAGIFISYLSDAYIEMCNITKKDFLKSLKNSLKIIEEENKGE